MLLFAWLCIIRSILFPLVILNFQNLPYHYYRSSCLVWEQNLSWKDFAEVFKSPKTVIAGLVCQFTIMPFLGFAIAKSFNFPGEIAAGIILIGCAPSGLASNVMAYLAKANLALSVCITSIATLLAPLLTPLLMKFLGGTFIEIEFWKMVWDITKMFSFRS